MSDGFYNPGDPFSGLDPSGTHESSRERQGLIEQDVSLDKKLAKFDDTAVKVVTSSPLLANYPVASKFLPVVSKAHLSRAGFLLAAQQADDSQMKDASWELVGAANALVATVLAGVGTGSAAVESGLVHTITTHTNDALLAHLDSHSGVIKTLKGMWDGTAFFSPSEKKAFVQAMKSPEYREAMTALVRGIADGAPKPAEAATKIANIMRASVGVPLIFSVPHVSEAHVHAGIEKGMETAPGMVKDAQTGGRLSKLVTKPLSTKVLPLVSVATDGRAAHKAWTEYYYSNPEASSADALAAAVTSSVSVVGSVISAASLNPRSAARMPKHASAVGLTLMIAGAAGSYVVEKLGKKRKDE